jgi:uncharacterized protein (TIGR03435 family)
MVHIHRIVAFLSLFAAATTLAQLGSPQNTPPSDINRAAAPAAPQDNPITDEYKIFMRQERPEIFGLVTVGLKAVDDAPDIEFTKVLHAPGTAQWSSANVFSQTTVLMFLPLMSRNPQQVDMWNGLVERFGARPVQLVLITKEPESTLLPWLAQHPMSGWLLYDPAGSTGRAYGLEMPNTVYVGTDRKIIAFSHGFVPRDEELNAVLDGRIRTEPVKPDPASLSEFAKSGKVMLQAEPSRMPRPEDNKPKFPPSYEVHITSSTTLGTTSASAPDYWSVGGFDLKSIVAQAYGVDESRIDFRDAAAAGKRYDVALVLPQPEDHDAMMGRIQDDLKQKFNLKIASEHEAMEVFVVTAPYGPGPKLRPAEDSMGGGFVSSFGASFALPKGQKPTPETIEKAIEQQRASSGITMLGNISVSGVTIEDFCKVLEKGLDRKVVDETQLTGHYDFNVVRGDRTRDEFFDMLREQLGLALTPEQRDVPMLVVRSM